MNKGEQVKKLVDASCHLCNSADIHRVNKFYNLKQVTSDIYPCNSRTNLIICNNCNLIQKDTDSNWDGVVANIYSSYNIYHQSGGEEQAVFNEANTLVAPRSLYLLGEFANRYKLPECGSMLDVGAGVGATLKAFSKVRPGWELNGFDLNDNHRNTIISISGVKNFHTKDLGAIQDKFDIITLIHVLEHVPNPLAFLATIKSKMGHGSLLLVQIPDIERNPYDLLVADHSSHFSKGTVTKLLEKSGFCIKEINNCIYKEITIIATLFIEDNVCTEKFSTEVITRRNEKQLALELTNWLYDYLDRLKCLNVGNVGIFGTAISGCWLGDNLEDKFSFFVDEDPARINKTFLGKKIIAPKNIPDNSIIIFPLPKNLMPVERILVNSTVKGIFPPDYE